VLLPATYQRGQPHRIDLVLHGRDSALTEAKFIATHRGRAPDSLPGIQLELFGRGNNAYRWSGETDLFEALAAFRAGLPGVSDREHDPVDPRRIVLRGFSMGGAGTWHIGLHHPGLFCVLGPGAGFTTTRGYVADLPATLPPHVAAGLHIYDAVDWAANAMNVPIVCYSGEKDAQRQAAVNIENALRNFPEPLRFTHLVAPGLEHVMPPEWQARAEAGYRQFAGPGREPPARIRFVTYTPAFGACDWLTVDALQQTLRPALVDGIREKNRFALTTTNVRRLALHPTQANLPVTVVIDGQTLQVQAPAATLPAATPTPASRSVVFGTSALDRSLPGTVVLERQDDLWRVVDQPELSRRLATHPEKRRGLTGPIDDAFRGPFVVVGPSQAGWSSSTDAWTRASLDQFAKVWERYFRGVLPVRDAAQVDLAQPLGKHLVLFGDPHSNPLLAQLLPRLPVEWTAERLVVGGQSYDPRQHLPALIFPNPADPQHYVVINSGHTFAEDDLRGTNALLYPRWGDWGVIRPTPTAEQPLAHELPASGLFTEFWQFPPPR
jgi:dienelactone hydrolase